VRARTMALSESGSTNGMREDPQRRAQFLANVPRALPQSDHRSCRPNALRSSTFARLRMRLCARGRFLPARLP